jgi:hypothetical protein
MNMLFIVLILGVFNLLLLVLLYFVLFESKRKLHGELTTLWSSFEKLRNQLEHLEIQKREDAVFPLKLQATERLIVLVERIKPGMLVHRQLSNATTASQLAALMLQNIRDEFEYNISQQLYVSERSWQLIVAAREEIVQLIHLSLSSAGHDTAPEVLASEMFSASLRFPDEALASLRAELVRA